MTKISAAIPEICASRAVRQEPRREPPSVTATTIESSTVSCLSDMVLLSVLGASPSTLSMQLCHQGGFVRRVQSLLQERDKRKVCNPVGRSLPGDIIACLVLRGT